MKGRQMARRKTVQPQPAEPAAEPAIDPAALPDWVIAGVTVLAGRVDGMPYQVVTDRGEYMVPAYSPEDAGSIVAEFERDE